MDYNSLVYPYASQRKVVYSRKGMVATSHPLATQAGLDIIKKGGNAIDAAVATAACLTVVEPTSNGIGGDAFAIVYADGRLHGLNSSGPAPAGISIDKLKSNGYDTMPKYGWIPVTVPGIPAAWASLNGKFGRLPLKEVLKPAIQYASEGYPVSPGVAPGWKNAFEAYKKSLSEELFSYWCNTFAPKGRAPAPGEVWSSEDHARTLSLIAETAAKSFYNGELADIVDKYSRQYSGYLRKEDLAAYSPEWVAPVSVNYRGYDVWELPPNGQGLVALIALKILNGYTFSEKEAVDTYHKQFEAIKLAFADGSKYITDPNEMKQSVEGILSEDYIAKRRNLIGKEARTPDAGIPPKGGTVYLAAADGEGNMVSYIQSNYMGFGSGVVVPGTGISLQNRGNNFSLDPLHENCLKPGKRTYHTIIPGFLTREGKPVGPFGVMGGFMQPQGHLQVVMNTIDFHLNPQAALDAPRWQWTGGKKFDLEYGFPRHIAHQLSALGHEVNYTLESGGYGRGEMIWRNEDGVLAGATEPRTDGTVAAW